MDTTGAECISERIRAATAIYWLIVARPTGRNRGQRCYPPRHSGLTLLPRSQQSPEVHQLRDMVRIVIRNQHRLAQDCLAITPGNLRT